MVWDIKLHTYAHSAALSGMSSSPILMYWAVKRGVNVSIYLVKWRHHKMRQFSNSLILYFSNPLQGPWSFEYIVWELRIDAICGWRHSESLALCSKYNYIWELDVPASYAISDPRPALTMARHMFSDGLLCYWLINMDYWLLVHTQLNLHRLLCTEHN